MTDDPTLRRCISVAQKSGFGGVIMGNLFALRTPDPTVLYTVRDPIGSDNDQWLDLVISQANMTAVAWGNRGSYMARSGLVLTKIKDAYCFGLNRTGEPRHPLYLPSNTSLVRYRPD
jgi:hypothetical protein